MLVTEVVSNQYKFLLEARVRRTANFRILKVILLVRAHVALTTSEIKVRIINLTLLLRRTTEMERAIDEETYHKTETSHSLF